MMMNMAAAFLVLAAAVPAASQGGLSKGLSPLHLNSLFDASPVRRALPATGVVAAPKMSERAPAPAAKADRRPAAARLHQDLVVPVPKETPSYRHTFQKMLANKARTDRFDELIIKYARKYRLDARFLKSVMAAESEFNPQALSPAGARGLMQVMPRTSESVGVAASRLHDPEQGIKAGAAYFQVLFKTAWRLFNLKGVRYTDVPHWVLQRVAAAYHAGPKFLKRKRWFSSTKDYVRKVVLFYHSQVTDLRRPSRSAVSAPSFGSAIAPSGTLY